MQVIQEAVVPKEPPPEYEFIADPPSISAFDLDVVKLTAQFVARNGRQFLTQLMQKEQRNYQFDFLRPQHSLFNYFTKLVEQYTKVSLTHWSPDITVILCVGGDAKLRLDFVVPNVDSDPSQRPSDQAEERSWESTRGYGSGNPLKLLLVLTVNYEYHVACIEPSFCTTCRWSTVLSGQSSRSVRGRRKRRRERKNVWHMPKLTGMTLWWLRRWISSPTNRVIYHWLLLNM